MRNLNCVGPSQHQNIQISPTVIPFFREQLLKFPHGPFPSVLPPLSPTIPPSLTVNQLMVSKFSVSERLENISSQMSSNTARFASVPLAPPDAILGKFYAHGLSLLRQG